MIPIQSSSIFCRKESTGMDASRMPGRGTPWNWYPRGDSNACFRLRRPALYPLSYGGVVKDSLYRRDRHRKG